MQAASPRLAVLALSAGSEPHAEFRCYQRASVRALREAERDRVLDAGADTITGEVWADSEPICCATIPRRFAGSMLCIRTS